MLDRREVKGGSNGEDGNAKSLRSQSLIGAPSLENGDTGVSQVLEDLRVSHVPVTISSSVSPNCSFIPRNSSAIWLKINKTQTKNLAGLNSYVEAFMWQLKFGEFKNCYREGWKAPVKY